MKTHPKDPPPSSLARIRRPSTVIAVGLALTAITVAPRCLTLALEGRLLNARNLGLFQTVLGCQFIVWIWWFLSPMASRSSWRYPLLGKKRWRSTFIHFGLALAFATVAAGFWGAVQFVLFPLLWESDVNRMLQESGAFWSYAVSWSFGYIGLPSMVAYCLIVTVTHGGQQARRLAEKEAELTRAQLEAIRMQMSPHFLFNALNSVSALASSKSPERATDLIARLGRALRESLAIREESMTDLENELDMLEDLIEIERARFGDRLKVRILATEDAMRTEVPRWLLQPLVENAIVHGIAPQEDGGSLTITARILSGPFLEVVVIDDGAGLKPEHSEGIGIGHTRRRLRALFGTRARLALASPPEGGTRATLTIPLIEESADAA